MRVRGWLRDPAWLGVVLVCALSVLSIATMVATRLLVPAEDAVIPTGAWPWTADGVAVRPITSASVFQVDDVVVAVDGRSLADWAGDALSPPWLLGAEPLGTSIDVSVIRGGAVVDLAVPIQPFHVERLGGAPLGLVAFAAGAMILALTLVVRRPRATALRLILVAVACDVATIVAWELSLQPTDLVVPTPFLYAFGVASVIGVVFWSALLHLLVVYPVRARWLAARPAAVAVVYVAPLAALAIGALLAALGGGGPLAWLDRLGQLLGAVVSAMIVLILGAIVAAWRRTPAPRRPQVRLVGITLFIAAAATLLLTTLQVAVGREPLVTRGVEALFALPVLAAIAIAVVRGRLFQVDLLVSSRARIVAAREEERLRLRRELHDGLGPTLAALGLKVDAARAAAADEPAAVAPLLDDIRTDVRSILTQVRTMARGLRPPTIDSLGLVGGLRQQVAALAAGTGTRIDVVADELPELPPGVEVAAYRIVVEAVTNVVRHAAATTASVRLIIDGDMLRIEVSDDGVGVDAWAIGVGTRSMYERAAEVGGELTIEPASGGGTVVTAVLPVRRRAADRAPTAADGSRVS
jgi:signal transduction histidine kinase